MAESYFVHESAWVDDGCTIGKGTRIWHFCHLMPGAMVGEKCILGQNVHIAKDVIIGNRVKIQNNVSVYTVRKSRTTSFGSSCVLTNVSNPRSQVNRKMLYERTLIKRGATIGANATVLCGTTVGRYAFIAAGAVVTRDVPDYALIQGCPGRQVGWMSRHGHRLAISGSTKIMVCPESGFRYGPADAETLRCLDLDEESPLPPHLSQGSKGYRDFKEEEL